MCPAVVGGCFEVCSVKPLVDCQVRFFDPVAVEFAENLRHIHFCTLHRALQFCNLRGASCRGTRHKHVMIQKNIPAAEYHADKTRISKHGLDLIHRAPACYKHALTAPHEESPALRIGTLVHMAVLEPVSYLTETAITPDGIDKRTKEGKAAWAEFQSANPGKLHISTGENALCLNVVEAIHKSDGNDLIKAAIIQHQVEVTLHADIAGVPAKARLDGFAMRTLFDVKTARNAGFRAFQRAAIDYRYHVQAAWYLDFAREVGIAADDFVFVVVETEPPFLATVYVADDQFIAAGRAEYKRDIEVYKRCLESDTWPGLPKSQTLTLPSWMEVTK